ncbi:MAG: response regulator transcription factor [Alphaproteobacteria bacterium]|jgi:FixJ family two-component response regulator|nr:response regulator transcription factor [Alphaproteobacteria bacterium]
MQAAKPVVYVVDDDRSVRDALEDLLASVGIEVRTFASVRDFLDQGMAAAPGCLVLDVRMPGQGGLDFHRQMAELGLRLPTIFITGHGDIAMGVNAVKAGAIDFLAKPFRDQELIDAIQRGIALDETRRREEADAEELARRWATLNPGEQDVLRLIARGLLNKQVAGELGVSEITVKVRRGRVMRKMGARTLVDLVRMADRLHPPDGPTRER